MVQLTVLVAALLLLAGVALANGEWCECYEMTCTPVEVDNGCGPVITHYVELCFEPWNGSVFHDGICGYQGPMDLLWDTRLRALTNANSDPVDAFLEFHGGINGVTGVVSCFGCPYTIRAHVVDSENCIIKK